MSREILSEQPRPTTMEVSRDFLKGWKSVAFISLNVLNVGASSFSVGLDLAQGANENALIGGISAGCSGAVVILLSIRH